MLKGKVFFPGLFAILLISILLIGISANPKGSAAGDMATFSSYEEMAAYLEKSHRLANIFGWGYHRATADLVMTKEAEKAAPSAPTVTGSKDAGKPSHSDTNIQVQGVDEADLVKTDGNYLYVVTGDKLSIIQAYPPGDARVLAEVKFQGRPQELFLKNNTLVVFGHQVGTKNFDQVFIQKYNVTDRQKPLLQQTVSCDGYYITSRMIGDSIYAVVNSPVMRYSYDLNKEQLVLPEVTNNGQASTVTPAEVHYFNQPDYSYNYTQVLSINMSDSTNTLKKKTLLTGTSQTIYASKDYLYLAGNKGPNYELFINRLFQDLPGLMPANAAEKIRAIQKSGGSEVEKFEKLARVMEDYFNGPQRNRELEDKIAQYMNKWQFEMYRDTDKTVVHKLAISDGQVEYKHKGEVNGRLLNQFSMDEHKGYFRLVTTTQDFRFDGSGESKNNIFILDEELKPSGQITGLAPTERIYSARFMGDRAYLVTFRQIDPLFVVDLTNPKAPKVLGELKIPGYSDYLHPYDENHLIGIGREVMVMEPRMAPSVDGKMVMPPPQTRTQGVKIALFDVTNPTAPKELAKYVLDRDDSDSPALYDHKAVLFSKEKNLLAIPINHSTFRFMAMPGVEAMPVHKQWQGVYVFDLSPQKGIKLRGTVEHPASGDYYNPVKRSLYIEDNLYSISEQLLKINQLNNLTEIKQVKL